MESTLKSFRGVFNVTAKLLEGKVGEAEVLYNAEEVTLEGLVEAVPTASGERHSFKVIAVRRDV